MKSEQAEVVATWVLRLIGGSICLAFLPIFFPLHWMDRIHSGLGMGPIPEEPIFEYLARSLSAMYFAHGCLVLMISSDVRRYLPMLVVVAFLNVFLGAVLLVTDILSPMPLLWTAVEGPPIMMVGGLLFWLVRALRDEPQPASED